MLEPRYFISNKQIPIDFHIFTEPIETYDLKHVLLHLHDEDSYLIKVIVPLFQQRTLEVFILDQYELNPERLEYLLKL